MSSYEYKSVLPLIGCPEVLANVSSLGTQLETKMINANGVNMFGRKLAVVGLLPVLTV